MILIIIILCYDLNILYKVPDSIIKCESLTNLSLTCVSINMISAPLYLPSLKSLKLQKIIFEYNLILIFPTIFPMIETFVIEDCCEDYLKMYIATLTLKILRIYNESEESVTNLGRIEIIAWKEFLSLELSGIFLSMR
ncbi:hypothetical protein GIB67_000022, partial [Kingdonia uniflora]